MARGMQRDDCGVLWRTFSGPRAFFTRLAHFLAVVVSPVADPVPEYIQLTISTARKLVSCCARPASHASHDACVRMQCHGSIVGPTTSFVNYASNSLVPGTSVSVLNFRVHFLLWCFILLEIIKPIHSNYNDAGLTACKWRLAFVSRSVFYFSIASKPTIYSIFRCAKRSIIQQLEMIKIPERVSKLQRIILSSVHW